ncbi:kelch-like protein [Murmansk poxvirus]|uniref:Kelch-like protein n=1 Tax=Murmansk poxvirus TaxID=2025359 RepID=A0A223FMM7_9POXV|nr:kelch-like protein [Murmansk poxvirus]AST09230.1 kelch-like protein [Murmansk poxvirus]
MPIFRNKIYYNNIPRYPINKKIFLDAIDGSILANTAIIKKLSPYFYNRSRSKYQKKESIKRINVDTDIDTLISIVIYSYTGKIYVDTHNVVKLLHISILLSLDFIICTCTNFILLDFRKEYCIDCYKIGIEHGLQSIIMSTKNHIINNFTNMENVIDDLDYIAVKSILESDDLNVPDEDYVINFINRWYSKRKNKLGNLMILIKNVLRVDYLSQKGLESIKFIIDNEQFDHKKPRKSYTYDFMNDDTTLDDIICEFNLCSSVSLGRIVYLIGGMKDEVSSNMVIGIDYEANKWIPVPRMNNPRVYSSAVFLNDVMYVIGGLPFATSVESWSHGDIAWKHEPNIIKPRYNPATACLNKTLYVIGGHSEDDTTVECLRYNNNQWEFIQPTNYPHYKSTAIVYNNKLFVVGIYSEVYDVINNSWAIINGPINPRNNPELILLDNKLTLFGGFYQEKYVIETEVYDEFTNSWVVIS